MSALPVTMNTPESRADRRKMIYGAAAVFISLGVLVFMVLRYTVLAPSSANDVSHTRLLIDGETGKLYRDFPVKDGTLYPWINPDTGKATLFPPETCYWTKDGKAKTEPTYVVLNELIGKPGKTKCPDCGRDVVGHNPKPPADLLIQAYKARAAKK